MQLRGWHLVSAVLALFAMSGCGEVVEDIDRTQPHYQEKALFEGQWYYRQTIVDQPPQNGMAFSGIEGALEKITWKIEQDRLVAYRTFEAVPGLNANDVRDGADFQGTPVAAFNITSHFDRIRDFNRQTGQSSNVLVEDTTLRPWYEREYMRVDWTSNVVDGPVDFSGFFFRQSASGIGSPFTFAWVRETDAFNPDHMQAREDFLFFTNSYVVSDGGWGCYLNYNSFACGEVEVKVRHAFSKIDPEEAAQFEPRPYLDREIVQDDAEGFTDANGNGRYDSAEHFEDANGNGRHDSGEEFVDRDGDGAWTPAEPFQDANENGKWDPSEDIKYAFITVGEDDPQQIAVACTDDVLRELEAEIDESDCRLLQFDEFQRFGYFRTERTGYDRRVGAGHDLNRQFFANHHQMWVATKDADGNVIAPEDRELRPVIYYLNPNFPAELMDTVNKLGNDWNRAFMEAAMAATGRSAETIANQLAANHDDALAVFPEGSPGAQALFQVRENNCSPRGVTAYVRANPELNDVFAAGTSDVRDPDVADFEDAKFDADRLLPGNLERTCSALSYFSRERKLDTPFSWQQMGDVRYSYIWLIYEDQPNGPLGYGPSSADPENGRIISGNAYVYGAAVDSYARAAADIVQAMNGDLCDGDDSERTDGLDCLIDGRSYDDWVQGSQSLTGPNAPNMKITEAFSEQMRRRMGTNLMEGYPNFKLPSGEVDKAAMDRHMAARMAHPHPSDPMARMLDAPLNQGQARVKHLMANEPSFRARMLNDDMLKLIGPLFQWTPGEDIPEEMEELALNLSTDPAAMGKFHQERQTFFAAKNVYLADHIDESVIGQALEMKGQEHEVVYQALRKEIFEAVMLHEIGHTVGLRHNFEASMDALNYQDDFWNIRERYDEEDWNEQRLPEFRYASIMDYGARFNSDTKGLGKYDYAAIKYVYGGHAERFASSVNVPGRLSHELEFNDYSKIPEMLGGDLDNLHKRENVSRGEMYSELRDGVLKNAQLFANNPGRPTADYWIDRTVPFAFCSDEYNGDLRCRTWDEGANHVEVVTSALNNYWNYYFFNSFRRGRSESAFLNGFFGRQARVRQYLTYPFQFYSFYDAYDVDVREDLLEAALIGINFVGQVLSTPTPGTYCYVDQFNTYFPTFYGFAGADQCQRLDVPIGDGRDLYLDFDEDYVYRYDYIGSYYDKLNFFSSLVTAAAYFFRLPDDTEQRDLQIGPYRAFEGEIVALLRDMMMTSLGFIVSDSSYLGRVPDGKRVTPSLLVDPQAGLGVRDTTTSRIHASVPYNLLWQGMALATIYNTSSYDGQTDFVEYLSIAEKGSGDDRTLAEGDAERIEFVHPQTGRTYVATRLPGRFSLSYDLLEVAIGQAADWETAWAAYQANPNDAQLAEDLQDEDDRLQNMVELMDDMRQLRSWVDWGN